jgi:hypothetical protein
LLDGGLDYNPETDEDPNNAEQDSTAEAQAKALSKELLPSVNDPVVHSHVLGDIWHLMDQFKISVHLPLSTFLQSAIQLMCRWSSENLTGSGSV